MAIIVTNGMVCQNVTEYNCPLDGSLSFTSLPTGHHIDIYRNVAETHKYVT